MCKNILLLSSSLLWNNLRMIVMIQYNNNSYQVLDDCKNTVTIRQHNTQRKVHILPSFCFTIRNAAHILQYNQWLGESLYRWISLPANCYFLCYNILLSCKNTRRYIYTRKQQRCSYDTINGHIFDIKCIK